jgi:transposase
VPKQLCDDQGFELLYTPPYISQLQPIELIWAQVKHIVSRLSHRTRSAVEAARQMRLAFDDIDAIACQKVIAHTHKWIDEFLRGPCAGNLARFENLAALVAADAI